MKLGIFGGTFNPIHYGHLTAAEEVKEKLGLDKIIFVPSGNPPLKDKELADAKHRYKMVKLAISKNHSFAVSDIEYKKKDKSYSVDTIEKLRRIYPGARLYFIAGIDAFIDIPNWWQPERLVSLADFIVISRPSYKFTGLASSPYLKINRSILKKLDDAKLQSYKTKLISGRDITMLHITPVEISATGIRKLIKRGKSIKYLLPEEVESYIITHKIYKG
ncbi:MAG: nicotinate-nucleotide adenylyltransferase [Nitrospirae bacterium]|nr:nicotinate-nucleotide adenylyltransferase [Nitrospirota bacterium]MBI3378139.1 nicotinate-nucleotide adenylyltransferase [Nitrospirota bacterium]